MHCIESINSQWCSMFDRLEQLLDRGWSRASDAFLVLIVPELKRIDDPQDRFLVYVVATGVAIQPMWLKLIRITGLMCLPFLVGMIGGFAAAAILFPNAHPLVQWGLFSLPSGMAAYFLFGMAWEVLHRRRTLRLVRATLHYLEYGTCPECAYDLRGHDPSARSEVNCPECGATVPVADLTRSDH